MINHPHYPPILNTDIEHTPSADHYAKKTTWFPFVLVNLLKGTTIISHVSVPSGDASASFRPASLGEAAAQVAADDLDERNPKNLL